MSLSTASVGAPEAPFTPPWHVVPACFDDEWCTLAVSLASDPAAEQLTYADRGPHCFRSSVLRYLPPSLEASHTLADDLRAYLLAANNLSYGFPVDGLEEPFVQEYRASRGDGLGWHRDDAMPREAGLRRQLSLVVQLSDPTEYEGGIFYFSDVPSPGEDFEPRGSLLIFPTTLAHRVSPVTKGVRLSLVSWGLG